MTRDERNHRTRLIVEGPFHEGDVLTIPYRMLSSFPIGVEEPDGWRHYVVLRRVGWFGRPYRLEGVRSTTGEVRQLEIPLRNRVRVKP